jgi:hypothetical protein
VNPKEYVMCRFVAGRGKRPKRLRIRSCPRAGERVVRVAAPGALKVVHIFDMNGYLEERYSLFPSFPCSKSISLR